MEYIYPQAVCQDCGQDKDDFCCDDVCVECEAKFLRANPDEISDTIALVKRDPVRFAPWQAAIDLLGDELEILKLIGDCECGNLRVNQNTIASLLRLAYSLGRFNGTNEVVKGMVTRAAA